MFCLSLLNKIQNQVSFDKEFVSLSTDSRSYNSERVFFCLYGENFDGFDFCDQVIEKGCKIIIYRSNDKNIEKAKKIQESHRDLHLIEVKDPIETLQDLARAQAHEFRSSGVKIIGITGSNGKTTTKEMLFHLLDSIFKDQVFATKGNLNNHIGVPLTVLSAPLDTKILIVEMGSNNLGEIKMLCEIANPEAGIISSIGAAHIGKFGSIENIFNEKTSLLRHVLNNQSKDSVFVLNNDDEFLARVEDNEIVKKFGSNCEYDSKILIENTSVLHNGTTFSIQNKNIREIYNLQNLVSTFVLSIELFPNKKEELLKSANDFKMPSLNRSEWIEKKGKLIFLDAYNANPTSMKAAINSFVESVKEKGIKLEDVHFILGDMNELGDYTEAEHKSVGDLLNKIGASSASFVGNYAHYYKETFSKGSSYPEKSGLVDAWPEKFIKHKAFFIKASRSLQLESLIDIT
jgi:UDP-N-acetylmuramoyl-tripeptide--D-alanyl-D-alanine ligase